MNRESLVHTAILGLVCLAPGVDAVPPGEAPAEVGTLDRVEQSPPAALPERRRRAITLDTAGDREAGEATMSRARHAFLAMDIDGNGAIDRRERALAEGLFMFDFRLVDADGDGRVGRAEHRAWSRRQAR